MSADAAALVEEHVGELTIVRPRDADSLLDEQAFEHEEYLPYWAELWPSALALTRALSGRSLRGARTLELGCGLGLPSIAAVRAGGRVLATDWSPDAVRFAKANASRNGVELDVEVHSWTDAGALVARGPWDLVLASDVLYERRNVDTLVALLPRLVGERGEAWIADPGRPPARAFIDAIGHGFERRSSVDPRFRSIEIHRLRARRELARSAA